LFLGIVFSLPATLGMASLALDLPVRPGWHGIKNEIVWVQILKLRSSSISFSRQRRTTAFFTHSALREPASGMAGPQLKF